MNRYQQHPPGCHPQTCKVQEKISMGYVPVHDDSCQKWPIAHVLHSGEQVTLCLKQPFPESSAKATHCRNHYWMVILLNKVTPD